VTGGTVRGGGRWPRLWWAAPLGLLLVLGTFLVARLGAARAARPEALRVFVRAEEREIDSVVLATGTIRLKTGAVVRVGSQVSGIVDKLNVGVGSRVRKGDLIATIDARSIEAAVSQAKAQVGMDTVNLEKARVDLGRGEQLDDLLPRQQEEDLRYQVRAAEAKLAKSRADLATIEVNLAYSEIRAPIAGVVASVSTQEGETVAASFSTPTFVTIIAEGALELVAMVDETDIGGLSVGEKVTFTTEAFPSKDLEGQVIRINPTATILSGVVNYEVVIAFDEPPVLLRPDMTASVSVRTARRRVLVLPDAAVQTGGTSPFAYVEKGGRLDKVALVVGSRDHGFTEIKEGLSSDQRVLLGTPGGTS
jgi:macrolide-specific efflux system membrane fusion protein